MAVYEITTLGSSRHMGLVEKKYSSDSLTEEEWMDLEILDRLLENFQMNPSEFGFRPGSPQFRRMVELEQDGFIQDIQRGYS